MRNRSQLLLEAVNVNGNGQMFVPFLLVVGFAAGRTILLLLLVANPKQQLDNAKRSRPRLKITQTQTFHRLTASAVAVLQLRQAIMMVNSNNQLRFFYKNFPRGLVQ